MERAFIPSVMVEINSVVEKTPLHVSIGRNLPGGCQREKAHCDSERGPASRDFGRNRGGEELSHDFGRTALFRNLRMLHSA